MTDANEIEREERDKKQSTDREKDRIFMEKPMARLGKSWTHVEENPSAKHTAHLSFSVTLEGAGIGGGNKIDPSTKPSKPFRRANSEKLSFGRRFSRQLRRSFRLTSRETEKGETTDIKPEVPQGKFTEYANIFISRYDETTYVSLDYLLQVLRRNRIDEIKRILRKNDWPRGHVIRTQLWQEISKKSFKNPNDFESTKLVYESEAVNFSYIDGRTTPPIKFLDTSDTMRSNYELNQNGNAALYRVISVLDSLQPNLTYAPLLRSLIAIFLHYMPEADAYACTLALLQQRLTHLIDTPVAHQASAYTLIALIKEKKPHVHKTLKNWIGSNEERHLATALHGWQRWIFVSLPFRYVIRVVDCYLYAGYKVLYRLAITILRNWHKDNKQVPKDLDGRSTAERITATRTKIDETAKHPIVSAQEFLESAFSIAHFPAKRINDLQTKYRVQLNKGQVERVSSQGPAALHTRPFTSSIMSPDLARRLMCELPEKFQIVTPERIYHHAEAGISFKTLWASIDNAEQTLMVVKSTQGDVFGAFCSESWNNRNDKHERMKHLYFGTGSTFVFKVIDKNVKVYPWIGIKKVPNTQNYMFMAAPFDGVYNLMVGGNSTAIHIREEILRGISYPSKTFDSPELVIGGHFDIADMEVFEVLINPITEEGRKERKLVKQMSLADEE